MANYASKRATTEAAPKHAEADPDLDNINFANYKGIYAEEGSGD